MAKTSSVYRNLKRAKMAEKFASRRNKLKKIVMDKTISPEERFQATLKLAEMPRNSAKIRFRNRCKITGRPKGYMRVFGLSRIQFREMASKGLIPGVKKASW